MNTKGLAYLICALSAPVFIGCGNTETESHLAEAPDYRNNPAIMGVPYKKFSDMQSSAHLPDNRVPWSGYYWATYKGGSSYRWQTMRGNGYRDFLYNLESWTTIRQMSPYQIDQLSPSEKYDLMKGDYQFSLTSQERRNTLSSVSNGQIPTWYGLCHGWAPAAYMEEQPGPVATVTNPHGIRINFYSSDIKALLIKHYGDTQVGTRFIGGRCNNQNVERDAQNRVISDACRDTNPATLHLVLENYIAHQKKSFVADVYSDYQVWNQPVTGYTSRSFNRRSLASEPGYRYAAQGTSELIDIQLTLYYINETSPSRYPVSPVTASKNLSYTLELDQWGYVIGGEWISEDRPDFLWELRRTPQTADSGALDYQLLTQLNELSQRSLTN